MSRPRLQLSWLYWSSLGRSEGRLHGCWLAEASLSESEVGPEAPESTIDLVAETAASGDGLGLVSVLGEQVPAPVPPSVPGC